MKPKVSSGRSGLSPGALELQASKPESIEAIDGTELKGLSDELE